MSEIVRNYIESTANDVMHCSYEGVAKKLMDLWFSKEYRDEEWSLYSYVELVDKRFAELTVPGFVQRRPRSISRELAYWKASEFKNWLLYFVLIILADIMIPEYYEHLKLYVIAMLFSTVQVCLQKKQTSQTGC